MTTEINKPAKLDNDMRGEKAKQRDKWLASKAGKNCCDPGILFSPCHAKYLRNRIEAAYCDGWDAGYAQGVMEALEED